MLATSVTTVAAQMPATGGRDATARVEGWRADIRLLVETAQRVHAGPRRPAHGSAFVRAARTLADRVPSLSDERIAVELQRLLALLGDGHSLLYPAPGPRVEFRSLPLDVWLFPDGVVVVAGDGAAERLVGATIEAFGDLATDTVLARLAPYISRDNEIGLLAFPVLYLPLPMFLEAVGVRLDQGRVPLRVRWPDGRRERVLLAAPAPRRARRALAPSPGAPPALAYRRMAEPHWMTRLAPANVLYAQINAVADGPQQSLAAFASALRDSSRRAPPSAVVLDLRHNTGGDNLLLPPLLEAIDSIARQPSAPALWVVTGRSTFSAAQNLITRLERRIPELRFAGEPSMSSPNFTGEDRPLTLPYSGLTVSISDRYWQDSAADDTRPFIVPHLPVAVRRADWAAGRDPVLDAILRALRPPPMPAGLRE